MKATLILIMLFGFSWTVHAQSSIEEGRFVSLYSGYGMLSSDLSGSGFNSNLPARGAGIFGASASYQGSESNARFSVDYNRIAASYNSPSGISPGSISLTREEFSFLATFAPWENGKVENLRLGIGYEYLKSAGSDTLPNNVVNRQTSQGILLSLSYLEKFGSDFSLLGEIRLYLPHQISEGPQTTGYNPKMMGEEARLIGEYLFSESMSVFTGVTYRQDQVSFDGSVDRGVTGGRDTRTLIAFPVGLKVGY
ncbi:MAG: hypothetical protein KF865_11275 [Bdellovibrionaceae bacterium]|nr:hypothetical protein [Pseudobdellovibrionaceae bacterium]